MYRLGLIVVAALLILTVGCGRSGQSNTQSNEQGNTQSERPERGNFGGGGRGQFSPEDMAKRQVETLGEFVTFAEGQEAKILEIYMKSGEKSAELRQGKSFRDMSDEDRQEMMAKMQTITAERDKEIKGLLSEEQQQQYDEYLKEMEKRRAERMQQRPQN